jgi:hypothetical protein
LRTFKCALWSAVVTLDQCDAGAYALVPVGHAVGKPRIAGDDQDVAVARCREIAVELDAPEPLCELVGGEDLHVLIDDVNGPRLLLDELPGLRQREHVTWCGGIEGRPFRRVSGGRQDFCPLDGLHLESVHDGDEVLAGGMARAGLVSAERGDTDGGDLADRRPGEAEALAGVAKH